MWFIPAASVSSTLAISHAWASDITEFITCVPIDSPLGKPWILKGVNRSFDPASRTFAS